MPNMPIDKIFSPTLIATVALLLLASCHAVDKRLVRYAERLRADGFTYVSYASDSGTHATWSRIRGVRPTVVLLHGITADGLSQWQGTARHLMDSNDVVMPDLLGHGGSIARWSGSGIDAQVAHVALLLDSLGLTAPVVLVGSSYGGVVAANFAEQHPERVGALVLTDAPISDYRSAYADSLAQGMGAEDLTGMLLATTAKQQRRTMRVVMHAPPPLPGFLLRQYIDHFISPEREGLRALLNDLVREEARFADHTYQWPMPVYLIWGASDKLIPVSTARGIMVRNHLPEDHLTIVPKAGHVPNLEQPAVFQAILDRILSP